MSFCQLPARRKMSDTCTASAFAFIPAFSAISNASVAVKRIAAPCKKGGLFLQPMLT
jgi:hypothetical protein